MSRYDDYYDSGGAHGIPRYEPERQRPRQMLPSQMRGPLGHALQKQQPRAQAPARPMRPDDPRQRQQPPRPPPQQPYYPPQQQQYYAARDAQYSNENLYDGSEYGQPEHDQPDAWPLPSKRPIEKSRGPSPVSRQAPPPQQPQRFDYDQPIRDQPRQRPPPQQQYYQQPPPESYHGSGQWTGDGYSPDDPPHPNAGNMTAQQMQQVYGRMNQRPPLGPPPSARRGPASYYPQVGPVMPIVEETDSMRGSLRSANAAHGSFGSGSAIGHGSFASSNAIPIGIPGYYLDDGRGRIESEHSTTASTSDYSDLHPEPLHPSGRQARLEDRDDGDLDELSDVAGPSPEPATMMRQASIGKRSKPKLTEVRSNEKVRKDSSATDGSGSTTPSQHRAREDDVPDVPSVGGASSDRNTLWPSGNERDTQTGQSRWKPSPLSKSEPQATAGSPVQRSERDTYWPGSEEKELEAAIARGAQPSNFLKSKNLGDDGTRTPSSEILAKGTGLIDASSSDSEPEDPKMTAKEVLGYNLPKPQMARLRARSPLAPKDPREEQIRRDLEKGGALESPKHDGSFLKAPTPGLSGRTGKKRPPSLNVEAVKGAEARGSLTSLPDLIKRNMRLASNLDRGKTASRLGMDWFTAANDGSNEKTRHSSGSISNILSSFPAPALGSPHGSLEDVRRSFTNFSKNSNLKHSALPSDSDAGEARKKSGRRCCGMPLWAFILLCVVLFLLVAAAVIVPVMLLVVVPNMDKHGSCSNHITCLNGGTAVSGADGQCRCICVNGYTGDTCAVASSASCTTISTGSTQNATIGDAIPRLLSLANEEFGVPLNNTALLGVFSSADISCNSENALVTFNGLSQRDVDDLNRRDPTPTLIGRQTTTAPSPEGAATSNGIVFASGEPSGTATPVTIPSSSTNTPTPGSGPGSGSGGDGSSGSSSSSTTSSETQDFARVAVLYILQESAVLTVAAAAQGNLNNYFTSGETATGQAIDPSHVDLGNSYSCDLTNHTLVLANGSVVGAGLGSSSSSSSSSSTSSSGKRARSWVLDIMT